MHSSCLLVLSLAVFGASAAPCSVIGVNPGCGIGLPGPTTFAQTPVIENPTNFIPSYLPPTSVSKSCHCMKTLVRPQFRNEVISVPMVDRLVRYVPSPVVETISVNCGTNTKTVNIPTCAEGVVTTLPVTGSVVGSGIVGSGLIGTGISGSGLIGSGIVGSGFIGTGIVDSCGCGSNIVV